MELWYKIATNFGSTLETLQISVQQPLIDEDFGPPTAFEFRNSCGFNWNFDFFCRMPNLISLKINVDGAPSRSGRPGTVRYQKLIWPFSRGFLQAVAHACKRLENLNLQGKFDKEAFDAFIGFRKHFCDKNQVLLKFDKKSVERIKELYGDEVEAAKAMGGFRF